MDISTVLALKTIILFGVAFLNFLLALLLWHKGKSKATFHLGLASLFSSLYALALGNAYFFFQNTSVGQNILILILRATWIGVLMLPSFITFFYYFIGRTKILKIESLLAYMIGVAIVVLSLFTPFFIKGPGKLRGIFVEAKSGILEPIGRIYILFFSTLILYNLLVYYLRTTGFKRLQIRYFISGVIIYLVVGFITTAFIPLVFRNPAYVDVTAYFSFFWILLTAYAILKYRLMNIRIVIGKGTAYLFSLTTIIGAGFLIAFLNNKLPQPLSLNFIVPIIAILSILLFRLTKFYERLAARYFYHTFYDDQKVLADLGEKLTQVIEINALSSLIIDTLKNTLKLERIAILTEEKDRKQYIIRKVIGFEQQKLTFISKNSYIVQYLKRSKEALVREELISAIEKAPEEEKKALQELKEKIKRVGIEVCLPLIFKRDIIGIVILGKKISGEAFSAQDLDLLTTLSRQASIAIKNASLYSEVIKEKEDLERFYKLTIGRELKMIELKKKIKELEGKSKEK